MDTEAAIPLAYQLMDSLHKDLPGLLLQPLHHHGLDIFFQPEPTALSTFLGAEHTHGAYCALDSVVYGNGHHHAI